MRSAQVDTVERSKEPVTVMTEEANEQHYGNDPAFFVAHLGPNLKYSACEWPSASNANGPNAPLGSGCTLAEAEFVKTHGLFCAGSRCLVSRSGLRPVKLARWLDGGGW